MDLKKFYGGLIVFYFSDMSLLIMIMWLSYQITKNPFTVGIILFISTITPFVIKKISKLNILALPLSALMILRIVLYVLVLALSAISPSGYTFVGMALVSGILGVSVLSNYESYNNCLVVNKYITADQAAKYMQTVIQIGAFGGAMIGGFLLNHLPFFWSIFIVAGIDIVFCVFYLFLARQGDFVKLDIWQQDTTKPTINAMGIKQHPLDKHRLWLLCGLLGLLGVHIISFNMTTPIIFQQIWQWNAQDFGFASAFAGMGAFLAVFFKGSASRCLALVLLLIVADVLFVTLSVKVWSLLACFFIGLFMNSIRIFIRAQLSLLAQDKNQAFTIGQYSAVSYTLLQASASLLFGYVLAKISTVVQWVLPSVAVLVLCLYVFWLSFGRKDMPMEGFDD